MVATNAYITVDNIVSSLLLTKGKSISQYWKYLKLTADAVRELAFSHMPLVNHTILHKPEGQSWFDLPAGYTDWVSVGVRCGERWRPIAVGAGNLMPFPRSKGGGEYDSSFNPTPGNMNVNGGWTNWLNPSLATAAASFAGDDFYNQDYLDSESEPSTGGNCGCEGSQGWAWPYGYGYYNGFFWAEWFDDWGESRGRMFGLGDGQRPDVVEINPEYGVIMCPACFPGNELYLVYIGIGSVDTMTHIPANAQAVIEAYVSWKYAEAKRTTSGGDREYWKREYYDQLRLYRARKNELTTVDIHRIICANYGQTQRIK